MGKKKKLYNRKCNVLVHRLYYCFRSSTFLRIQIVLNYFVSLSCFGRIQLHVQYFLNVELPFPLPDFTRPFDGIFFKCRIRQCSHHVVPDVCPLGRAGCCVRGWSLMSVWLCLQIEETSGQWFPEHWREGSISIFITDSGLFCDPGPLMRPVRAGLVCYTEEKFYQNFKGKCSALSKTTIPGTSRLPVALRASLQLMWVVKNILVSPASLPCIHPGFLFLKGLLIWKTAPGILIALSYTTFSRGPWNILQTNSQAPLI